MTDEITRNIHDSFFQQAVENPQVLKELVEAHAPKKALKYIDTKKLEIMPGTFISLEKRKFGTDLVCKTKLKNDDGYLILLIEQQTKPEKMMPFRIFRYTCEIMAKHLEMKKKLPLVLPIVISNYKHRYNQPTDICDIISAPKPLIDEYFMAPFHLVDLSQINDDTLKEQLWAGILALAMKRVHTKSLPEVIDLLVCVEKIYRSGERSFSIHALQYIIETSKLGSNKKFLAAVNESFDEKFGSKVMTLAQRFRAEGALQRDQQVVANMLKENFEPETIKKITGLKIADIKKIAKDLNNNHAQSR